MTLQRTADADHLMTSVLTTGHRSRAGDLQPIQLTQRKGDPVFTVINSARRDQYRPTVRAVYTDPPHYWEQVLGKNMWFQGGVYDRPDIVSLEESGERHFDCQLEFARLLSSPTRILDIGCGWGVELHNLACRFPECKEIDGISVSETQLDYCAERLTAAALDDRVSLYLCNAQDVGMLPYPERPYDLVVMRGASTHFPPEVLENTLESLASRMTSRSVLIIAENLYCPNYRSAIPDDTDRLACRHRKTPANFIDALERNLFKVDDMRVFPSNRDMITWWHSIRKRAETLPNGTPTVFDDLRRAAANMEAVLAQDMISAYSIIARKFREQQ